MTGNKYFTQNRKNRDQNFVTSGEQSKGTAMGSPRNDWRKFKKLRNMVNNEIKRAKECHYKHALNEYQGDPRNTWRIINELMSRKSHKSIINELKLSPVAILFMILMSCVTPLMVIFFPLGRS